MPVTPYKGLALPPIGESVWGGAMNTNLMDIDAAIGALESAPAGGARSAPSYTSAALASGGVETGSIMVPKAYSILRLVTDYPARVMLYLSSAQRDADGSRPVTVDPSGNHGCILESVTTATLLTLDLSPVAIGASPLDATTAYVSITNMDTVSRAITATFSVLSMEG